uniref:E2F/DP family winged-helix DNA-binding domain-containing protein n=1 Tax=Timema bartmani TaxID=61472 RepID=A0A7R9EZH9_9NEOP|nr:unnamed protein product [Timema bartmani]
METLTCGSPKRKVFADILNNMTINEPSSPMSNLKLLTDVAIFINNQSKENEIQNKTKTLPKNVVTEQESETKCLKKSKSRKEKSLSMLCDKFLEFYPLNVDSSTRVVISIDRLTNLLCTERRRVYDIINILESLQMTVKLCKNRYEWYGCKQLHVTLAHLKGFAVKLGLHKQVRFPEVKVEDFMETSLKISKVFEAVAQPLPFKISTPPYPDTLTETSARPLSVMSMGQPSMDVVPMTVSSEDYIRSRYQPILPKKVELLSGRDSEDVGSTEDLWGDLDMERDIRDCNSLGVLCQKFVMLFLLTNKRQLLTLELASRILVGGVMDRLVNDITNSPPFQGSVKTKVRRLYDIANVLTSLRLICKVQASNLKKPAFSKDFDSCYTIRVLGALPTATCNNSQLRQGELAYQWVAKSRLPPPLA